MNGRNRVRAIEDVIGPLIPAVVLVEISKGRGSGFFVSPDMPVTKGLGR